MTAYSEIISPHCTVSYSLQGARHAVTQSMTNWLRSAHFSIVSFSKLTRMPNEDVLHLKKFSKGGLISNFFSIWIKFPKKCQINVCCGRFKQKVMLRLKDYHSMKDLESPYIEMLGNRACIMNFQKTSILLMQQLKGLVASSIKTVLLNLRFSRI